MNRIFRVLCCVAVLFTFTINQSNSQTLSNALVDSLSTLVNTLIGDGCMAGGEGSTSCRLTLQKDGNVTVLGSGGGGGASVTVTVSCQPGYYACCNLKGAVCKAEDD